ncbi:MAG: translation initiation factor [Deltaproteobacteria bacterium]|nr:translation initiation factor [Deltaproteobacteria bacterium]
MKPGPSRAVVHLERNGHGGKEMTRVEQLELGAQELGAWLRELKRSLGCGGTGDGATLLIQGDQRERVATWLADRGVGTVVQGCAGSCAPGGRR